MTWITQAPRRILAVMDDSDTPIALRAAKELAEKHGAELRVFACLEPPHDLNVIARLSGKAPEALLALLVERLRQKVSSQLRDTVPDRNIVPHVTTGKAFVEIIRHAAETDCDFLVKTAEPLSGLSRFLFSSTDQHLLRKCPCPVWLQTAAAPAAPHCVLAAIDLDMWDAAEPETLQALNRRVLETAFSIVHAPNARVIVLHAWDALGEGMVWTFAGSGNPQTAKDRYINEIIETRQRAMDQFLAPWQGQDMQGVHLASRLERGAAEQVIEEQSRKLGADVVVMGTVARKRLEGVIIGNTAENIINTLACPILAVKPKEFLSPIL